MCRPGQVGQVDSRMASVGVLDSWARDNLSPSGVDSVDISQIQFETNVQG